MGPHTVEVMETTDPHPHLNTPHPHLNTTVGTDKDTRFNMVEVMGPDTQLSLNLTEEVMGPDPKLSLNPTVEVTKLPPMEDIRPQVTEATIKEVMEVRIRRWEPDPEIPWNISLPL